MSDRATVDTTCPNNHNLTVTFTKEKFEDLVKSGELVLHCNTCDTNWPPTGEEIAGIRAQFAKQAAG
jgi:hypothetical protein